MRVNPANLRDFPGRSGVPTEIAYRGLCQLTQPNLEDLHFLDIYKSFRTSYPPSRSPLRSVGDSSRGEARALIDAMGALGPIPTLQDLRP